MTWTQVLPPSISLPLEGQQSVQEQKTDVFVALPVVITGDYNVLIDPNWNTTVWCSEKTSTGFTVTFGTPAPPLASIDWGIE
jgi:hypothetical protein